MFTVIHDNSGYCEIQTDEIDAIITALWGKHNVCNYVIYAGECPYRFFVGNLRVLKVVLTDMAPKFVRREQLPIHIFGLDDYLICVIGSCDCVACEKQIAKTTT